MPRKSKHETLIVNATKAIDTLNNDTRVSMSETLADLKGVRDHLDILINALHCSINGEDTGG